MSRGWAKASACLLQVSLSCAVLYQMVSLQYLSRSLFTACPGRLFSLSSFLVIWSPSGDTGGPSVVFKAVDVPCPGPFHFSHIADYITMRGHTSFLYTRSLDSIRYIHRITSGKKYVVLEDETERGLDYDKGNPTEGCQSQ